MYKARCALCDGWYDPKDPAETRIHRHPEPQSGQERVEWLLSGLTYEEWAKKKNAPHVSTKRRKVLTRT